MDTNLNRIFGSMGLLNAIGIAASDARRIEDDTVDIEDIVKMGPQPARTGQKLLDSKREKIQSFITRILTEAVAKGTAVDGTTLLRVHVYCILWGATICSKQPRCGDCPIVECEYRINWATPRELAPAEGVVVAVGKHSFGYTYHALQIRDICALPLEWRHLDTQVDPLYFLLDPGQALAKDQKVSGFVLCASSAFGDYPMRSTYFWPLEFFIADILNHNDCEVGVSSGSSSADGPDGPDGPAPESIPIPVSDCAHALYGTEVESSAHLTLPRSALGDVATFVHIVKSVEGLVANRTRAQMHSLFQEELVCLRRLTARRGIEPLWPRSSVAANQ